MSARPVRAHPVCDAGHVYGRLGNRGGALAGRCVQVPALHSVKLGSHKRVAQARGMECRVFGVFKKRSVAKGRIGVVFGKNHIAVAVVTREGDVNRLTRCDVLPLPADEAPDALATVMRGAGLPRLPVSAVLGAEDYQLALVEAPDVPPA